MYTNAIALHIGILLLFGFVVVATVWPPFRHAHGIQNDICKSVGLLGGVALSQEDISELHQIIGSRAPQQSSSVNGGPPSIVQFLREARRLKEVIRKTKQRPCRNRGRRRCKAERKVLHQKLQKLRQSRKQYLGKTTTLQSSHHDTDNKNQTYKDLKVQVPSRRRKRGAVSDSRKLWPGGVIPYIIQTEDYKTNTIVTIQSAMQRWEEFTCLVFREREPEDINYIVITRTPCGCCSDVGMEGTGPQILSLDTGCLKRDIIIHELGHAIGYYHEHNRPDRDEYIDIIMDNITPGREYAFAAKINGEVNSLGEKYDYDSIMHYPRNKFSRISVLDTIKAKKLPGQKVYPQLNPRYTLSDGDIRQTNILYKCPKCGGTLQSEKGSFDHKPTPEKPEKCQWRISVTPGGTVKLNVTSFDIPGSPGCEKNYLEVRDGPSHDTPVIGRYCGSNAPGVLRSTNDRMWVEVVTTGQGQGFKADYEADCHGYVAKRHGEIASPGYPKTYKPNVNCTWVLSASKEGANIHLTFEDFYLEYKRSCPDYVEVRDGPNVTSPLIGKYCHRKPSPVQSTGRDLFVRFVTNRRRQKKGFMITYVQDEDECEEDPGPCEQVCENTIGSFKCSCYITSELHSDGRRCVPKCGGVFTSGTGSITSPSYPDLYPPDKTCEWLFDAPPNHIIFLDFVYFDLEGDIFQECENDYLRINEGDGYEIQSIGKFCGFLPPPHIVSKHDTLRLQFVSDDSVQKSGFNITYVIDEDECKEQKGGCDHICTNTIGSFKCSCLVGYTLQEDGKTCRQADQCSFNINQPSGRFSSVNFPLPYFGRMDCTWSLQTYVGHRIRIKFKTFTVEYHRSCLYDHLSVYDGANDTSPWLATMCGYKRPEPVVSSSNHMFLYFFSDASKQFQGFFIEHDTICSGDVIVDTTSQTLVSHGGYGTTNYANRQNCSWRLLGTEGYVIEIIFDNFQVEYEEKCRYDSMTIYDGDTDSGPYVGTFCGDRAPSSLVSTSHNVLIKFTSDDTIRDKGFNLIFHQLLPSDVKKKR